MSESVPSSNIGFAHSRSRADSVTSFTYFQEDEQSPEWSDDEAVIEQSIEELDNDKPTNHSVETLSLPPKRRRRSSTLRNSVEDPLLYQHDSARTNASISHLSGRFSQKIYIVDEDLTIVISGFATSLSARILYAVLCVLSLGLIYLLLYWLPRWKVYMAGTPKSLGECTWVVIEVALLQHQVTGKLYADPSRTSGVSLKSKTWLKSLTSILYPLCSHQRANAMILNQMKMTIHSL